MFSLRRLVVNIEYLRPSIPSKLKKTASAPLQCTLQFDLIRRNFKEI